ncbi:MAG: polyprenol monophosphomannose synthase, partial [Candidatus Omnitrophica bacterium]|nr:polyprenol monophosphomannose synthase [Candidatus Omnitrophota bacterium]
FCENNARIHLLEREKKQGIGPAYIAGFKWALARDYEAVIEMDADLSHRPRYLPTFLEEIQKYDVVAGSRWIKGGGIANWSLSRVLLSRLANLYSRWVLGVPIYDLTGGFTCYRRRVLEEIDLDAIRSDGYSFQIEMKYRVLKKNFRLHEIPIWFTDRKAGASKISRKIVWEALGIVWFLKFTIHESTSNSMKQRTSLAGETQS